METYFPEQGESNFQDKISRLKEYQMYQTPSLSRFDTKNKFLEHVDNACGTFEKTVIQGFAQHYLSKRSPYRGLLLFHGLGVGKTCSAITVAESMLQNGDEQVWIVMSDALQKSFQQQLFDTSKILNPIEMMDQCTGDLYLRIAKTIGPTNSVDELKRRIEQLVKQRYKMMTYDGFHKEIDENTKSLKNITLIIDEAHNLRSMSPNKEDKDVAKALVKFAEKGINNRIVLLSATPMYNESTEISWLLSILAKNDKIENNYVPMLFDENDELTLESRKWLEQMSSQYISYVRGVNPFTFATRLSPKESGIKVEHDDKIPGGLYVSKMSPSHESSLRNKGAISSPEGVIETGIGKVFSTVLHEYTNIGGVNGTATYFDKTGYGEPYPLKYKPIHVDSLKPGPNLALISPKINAICDLIKKSEGIVVIFSQFVKNGVTPMAIALEHMGFERFNGTNMVINPSTISHKERVTYPDTPNPTYTILTRDKDIMGKQKIDTLIKQINDQKKNLRGQSIKVVILSPVASEGLSLRNVREVHILDPWYHLNRLEQVIGRAIRTCSHTDLNLEERNVTVFLHASGFADIHTYVDLAAKKVKKVNDLTEIIREHAIDCSLQKHANYFPKSLFGFDVEYRTSRGVVIKKSLGDDDTMKPRCKDPPMNEEFGADGTSMRTSITDELVHIGMQRLRKYIRRTKIMSISKNDIIEKVIKMPLIVVNEILRRATNNSTNFVIGHRFYQHRNMYYIEAIEDEFKNLQKIRVLPSEKESKSISPEPMRNIVIGEFKRIWDDAIENNISNTDMFMHTCWLYINLRIDTWNYWGRDIVENHKKFVKNNETNMYIKCLTKQGALINANELDTISNTQKRNYIGYLNVFHEPTEFDGEVWDESIMNFRPITTKEKSTLQKKRILQKPPQTSTSLMGILLPDKKDNIFKFKIIAPNSDSKKGRVCDTQIQSTIKSYLKDSFGVEMTDTKKNLCKKLMSKLLENNQLYIAPYYKPKN